MDKLLNLILSVLLIACSNGDANKEQKEESQPSETSEKRANVGKRNFAVVWHWKTTDKAQVDENVLDQTKQLAALWKEGVIENAYFETQPQADSFEDYPGISFFIKANSKEEAAKVLDEMIFVKKAISGYTLHPVGTKWLGRQEDIDNEPGTRSWVAVWSTSVDYNSESSKNEVEQYAKEQSDAILNLWKEGVIENAYFDIEGTQKDNEVTDFVFFINAKTESDARDILNDLPFYKKNIANYQLFSVGVFWMGE